MLMMKERGCMRGFQVRGGHSFVTYTTHRAGWEPISPQIKKRREREERETRADVSDTDRRSGEAIGTRAVGRIIHIFMQT